MKTKKKVLLYLLSAIFLAGCNSNGGSSETNSSNVTTSNEQTSSLVEESTSNEVESTVLEESVESSTVEVSSQESSPEDTTEYTTFVEIDDVIIEENERYSLKSVLNSYTGVTAISKNINVASYFSTNKEIIGKKVGTTYLVLTYKGQKQRLNVTVVEKGTFSTNFSFDRFRLENKNLVAFGDSVTADATLRGTGKTYVTLFAEKYGMNLLNNYAIGGTTGTYMYFGSNIYREYATNKNALDGCRVVKNALDNEELDNVDYAFIAFGHNDQYFQPPITTVGDEVGYGDGSFDHLNSFKGSYRYMIDALRVANENVRIILLNCTYSEYDKTNISPYGHTYTYTDYRNAIHDIAIEKNCRYIDPWDYLKDYFDFYSTKTNYGDSVHLTANGHKVLSEYIFNN